MGRSLPGRVWLCCPLWMRSDCCGPFRRSTMTSCLMRVSGCVSWVWHSEVAFHGHGTVRLQSSSCLRGVSSMEGDCIMAGWLYTHHHGWLCPAAHVMTGFTHVMAGCAHVMAGCAHVMADYPCQGWLSVEWWCK